MEATRVAVSRRGAILFCSISRAASRWMVRRVDTPKPTMSTTTMRSPIFSASGERNTELASAARGPRDGLIRLRALRDRPVAALGKRAALVETRRGAHGGAVGDAPRRGGGGGWHRPPPPPPDTAAPPTPRGGCEHCRRNLAGPGRGGV